LILRETLLLMAPILPFTTEEAWENMPSFKAKEESVHLAFFPQLTEEWLTPEEKKYFEILLKIRDKVLKALEEARAGKLIGNSLEAKIILEIPPSLQPILDKYFKDLPMLFIVSAVEIRPGVDPEGKVTVELAPGQKCQRCWNYSLYVGKSIEYPELCSRCEAVLKGEG